MREILFFAIGASLTGTVFLVSLIELIFTAKRRREHEQLDQKIKEIKTQYNQSINELVLKDDAEITAVQENLAETASHVEEEKETIEKTYKDQIESLTAESKKALEAAKAKAKKMEALAKQQAEDYLESRQQEVEEELMDLVISVTKKVLPKGLTYEAQKQLVMDALRDVKTEGEAQ
ncbi:MAG: hypothetical protein K0S20_666 [Patescibacteria group bacterium]|jgi:Skp family chaperone for outer membrane proteins|nr:hypothetical protein [Patescibacteria group bacterium]